MAPFCWKLIWSLLHSISDQIDAFRSIPPLQLPSKSRSSRIFTQLYSSVPMFRGDYSNIMGHVQWSLQVNQIYNHSCIWGKGRDKYCLLVTISFEIFSQGGPVSCVLGIVSCTSPWKKLLCSRSCIQLSHKWIVRMDWNAFVRTLEPSIVLF